MAWTLTWSDEVFYGRCITKACLSLHPQHWIANVESREFVPNHVRCVWTCTEINYEHNFLISLAFATLLLTHSHADIHKVLCKFNLTFSFAGAIIFFLSFFFSVKNFSSAHIYLTLLGWCHWLRWVLATFKESFSIKLHGDFTSYASQNVNFYLAATS